MENDQNLKIRIIMTDTTSEPENGHAKSGSIWSGWITAVHVAAGAIRKLNTSEPSLSLLMAANVVEV
jgi:hypothetical protein